MSSKLVKLASEKNLNKFVFPVISIKGKPIEEYPYIVSWKTDRVICENGRLGPENLMIMDVFGTYNIHKHYNNFEQELPDFSKRILTSTDARVKHLSNKYVSYKLLQYIIGGLNSYTGGVIPESYYSDDGKIPSDVDRINDRIKKPQTIKFTDTYLKKELPFLKKYSSKRLCEIITNTSECKIKMKYPIRFFDGKNYQNFLYANNSCASSFFTLVGVKESKFSKNGNVLEREYIIRFDTLLGYFFIQNNISTYTDLLPGHFYQLSNYAQLFYRMLILPYYNNAKIPITLDEIKHRLVLKSENYMTRKTIKRILDELESNSFIKNPDEIKLYGSYEYSYEKSSWKDIAG